MVLKSFIGIFSTQSVILAKKLEQHLDGPEFDIQRYVSLCKLDTVCATTRGINLEAQERKNRQYQEAAHEVLVGIAKRAISPWLHPDFIFYRTQLGKDERKYTKFMHGVADNIISERKAKIVQHSDQQVSAHDGKDGADNSVARPQFMIENLLRLSSDTRTLTDKSIRDHIDAIITGSSETTAITVNYLMLMLASHQDIQDKVYHELCENFGKHVLDDDSKELHITMEVLTKTTFMERVIKETMRLFPVAPVIARQAADDFDLGPCTLPRGSSIILNIMGVHRSKKYWPDPLKFDPDRFSPERFSKQQPYSYLPFSSGRRNCIGSKYAMMLMKTTAATILRKYVLTKDEGIPI